MSELLLMNLLPSGSEWLIILVVFLLLFGRGLGKGVKSFKEGVNEAKEEIEKAKDEVNEPSDKK